MFDELKEVKYFKEVTDFYRVLQCKILLKNKIFKKKKKKKTSKKKKKKKKRVFKKQRHIWNQREHLQWSIFMNIFNSLLFPQ